MWFFGFLRAERTSPTRWTTHTGTHAQTRANTPAFRSFAERHGLSYSSSLRSDLRTESASSAISCSCAEKRAEPPGDDTACQPQVSGGAARTQLLPNYLLVVCQRIRGEVASTAGRCCCGCCCETNQVSCVRKWPQKIGFYSTEEKHLFQGFWFKMTKKSYICLVLCHNYS